MSIFFRNFLARTLIFMQQYTSRCFAEKPGKLFVHLGVFYYWATDTVWSHRGMCLHIYMYIEYTYISWCIKRFDSAFRHKHPVSLRASNKLSESFDSVCYLGKGGTGCRYRRSQFQRQAILWKINPRVNAHVRPIYPNIYCTLDEKYRV